ncbi:MAG: hypothetical protein GY810_26360 [Aureispira sp.]|nr:hypothetical protein [Aureispira sp.]
MNKLQLFCSLSALALLLSACSTSRLVRPLDKKEVAIGLDFGGPIIDFAGAKIPIPLSSITAGYGIDSTFTVYGSLHTTDLAFRLFHLEAGVLKELTSPKKGWIPGISVGASSHFMVDGWEGNFRAYPQLDLNFYWQYLKKHRHFFYFNWTSWFDFWTTKAHNQPNYNLYIPSFGLGHTFITKKWRYTVEVKWLAPSLSNRDITVSYNGIGRQGSVGVYLSFYRTF